MRNVIIILAILISTNVFAQSNKKEKFNIGDKATELVGKTPEGKDLRIKDFKGKYVLIDFWASWCGPCKSIMPELKAVYNKYHDKGFEIISVSIDDDKDKWIEAIKEINVPWHHVSDLGGFKGTNATNYGLWYIPKIYLLDKKGKIAGIGLHGQKLEEKLESIFNK